MSGVSRDRRGAWLAGLFVFLLLASEAVLTLPDESASDVTVAEFYVSHRSTIIVVQIVGLIAAALLAAFAVHLRPVDRIVASTGLLTALLACAPGLATIVLAVVADTSNPASAGVWNQRLPLADDLLFGGIVLFGLAVAIRLRSHRVLAVLGGLAAVLCLGRLLLETTGSGRGWFETLGPLAFVVLMGAFAVACWRGTLLTRTSSTHASGV